MQIHAIKCGHTGRLREIEAFSQASVLTTSVTKTHKNYFEL